MVTEGAQFTNKIDQKDLKPKLETLSYHFDRKYHFSSFLGLKRTSTGLMRYLDALKKIKWSQGIHNLLTKSVKTFKIQIMDLDPSFWRKLPFFVLFAPVMEVHRSVEVSGCTEINQKFTRDTQSTNKVDQTYLQPELWTTRLHFCRKYGFLVIF
jgi:hypothetical protein